MPSPSTTTSTAVTTTVPASSFTFDITYVSSTEMSYYIASTLAKGFKLVSECTYNTYYPTFYTGDSTTIMTVTAEGDYTKAVSAKYIDTFIAQVENMDPDSWDRVNAVKITQGSKRVIYT